MATIDDFITRWQGQEGGAERANYALFLSELCDVLGVKRPDPASAAHEHNDYVFERAVIRRDGDAHSAFKRIDLYKKDCFILEAKQSRWQGGDKAIAGQEELFTPTGQHNAGRRTADRNWDILMRNARRQAEEYALMLPADHDWPPFVIVCDVGHAFEIYADFNGKGRDYTQFPDRQGFRIYLEDLRRDEIRERLRLIWTDPAILDPTKKAAKATRDVAERLAEISKSLEKRGYAPERVAQFLMRCLFTMFAEDVELLPRDGFKGILEKCRHDTAKFEPMVSQLWAAMNAGDWAFALEQKVKRFNGEFFRNPEVLRLDREEIGELLAAASKDWRNVEPAIFGSLLEGALDPTERSRLGAHYTPRAYVERLVLPTIMEPLRADWLEVSVTAEKLLAEDKRDKAIAAIRDFHAQLCALRILDPACGTGNFLYVAMDKIKQLEDEVLEALVSLGGQEALALDDHRVDPQQFLGLEINPRAAAIAELVLWIGFLQIHYRSNREHPEEPILKAFHNVECRDAVLTWDGYPLPRVVEGRETYPNPRPPDWPAADFIVGNPPFLGKGEPMRHAFGDAYLRALWAANPKVNKSADFVMYWWNRAAELLGAKGGRLRHFGLVTTNSITQVFNRRVVERHLGGAQAVSLSFAIPDHPWTRATKGAAAVRIAMTCAARGMVPGRLSTVERESDLDSDEPRILMVSAEGKINADLTVGVDLTKAKRLQANEGMSSNGMMLAARGFVIPEATARRLIESDDAARLIKPFLNGGDLLRRPRKRFVIDATGFEPDRLRTSAPHVYEHLLETVFKERKTKADPAFRERWWLFGRQRPEIRSFLPGLTRYIGTTETAKHRIFQFIPATVVPDHMIVAIGSADAFHLGVLSSRIHIVWSLRAGGWLGVGNDPRYSKSRTFDPFPFPDPAADLRADIAELAETLDAQRKRAQAEHPDITLTEMYNVLEKLRRGAALTEREADIETRGLILILRELHDELDAAMSRAYGWPADLADEQVLDRLVALNAERAAEEAGGLVRWLRPDYQIARFGSTVQKTEAAKLHLVAPAEKGRAPFPADERRRTSAIYAVLAGATGPVGAADIAGHFRKGRQVEREIGLTLRAFMRYGDLVSYDGGETFQLRRRA